MLTITETAGAHLAQLLVENDASEDVAIRFLLVGEKLRPILDDVRPGDVTFKHQGKTILALDEPLSERLADTTLDVKEAGDGKHLSLR
jgi:Fe-S cluster assembly iron-binding protein IscA